MTYLILLKVWSKGLKIMLIILTLLNVQIRITNTLIIHLSSKLLVLWKTWNQLDNYRWFIFALPQTKGQIISECPFEILDFPKIPRKIWQISALESEKWSNHKIKALYNIFNTLNNKFDHIYYKKVPLSYDLTTF